MTLRERMKRRGWHQAHAAKFTKNIDGAMCAIYLPTPILESGIVIIDAGEPWIHSYECAREGLPSLAQRARALVRGRKA